MIFTIKFHNITELSPNLKYLFLFNPKINEKLNYYLKSEESLRTLEKVMIGKYRTVE